MELILFGLLTIIILAAYVLLAGGRGGVPKNYCGKSRQEK